MYGNVIIGKIIDDTVKIKFIMKLNLTEWIFISASLPHPFILSNSSLYSTN